MIDFKTQQGPDTSTKIAMFLLAASPIMIYYALGSSPLNYYQLCGFLVLVMAIFTGRLRFSVPKFFLAYWIWCAFQIYFIVGVQGWSDNMPGGINLFMFGLSLFGYIAFFDLDVLYKYMKWIVVFASVLYLIQFLYYMGTGVKISFFLPLSQQTTYCGWTYAEVVKNQTMASDELIQRFSSIFAEPSYFGQYLILFLGIELFKKENRNKLYSKFSLFVIFMLMLLRSGAGFFGLIVVAIAKCIDILITTKDKKYYLYIFVMLALAVPVSSAFLSSDFGAYVNGRTAELNSNDSDSSIRLFFGWNQLGLWNWHDIILGGGRNMASNYTDNEWGSHQFINTAVIVIMYQGIIGAVLLLMSYIRSCKGNGALPIVLSVILLANAFLENFLYGGMMVIVSTIVFSIAYFNKISGCRKIE